ncbi:hypothetical protein [Aeromicrobium sp. Root472D3]|uniref:hypothetical protein n=1 Tax=Aeromicrobium sp. Root472D3 TaxID=1736540 RepID=UPI0006FD290E|nr:hypothetical protein [Aeromicrobium sp. Root472D3]KQX75335.1 hypothetical protein ASD10_09200 [Aeromicrobium sp. Root472D3]
MDDHDATEPGAEGLETIWAPRRTAVTVLATLPAVLVSSAVSGVLLSIVVAESTAVLVAVSAAVVVTVVRVVWWVGIVAGRSIAVSDSSLAVRRGDEVLGRILWSDVDAVRLDPGDGLLRVMVDVFADATDFPNVSATSANVWDVERRLPSLFALLPSEVERLRTALAAACAARSVSLSTRR